MENCTTEIFEVVEIFEQPALFSNFRIDKETVPKGYSRYELRDGDCGEQFLEIADKILVNFSGTIITKNDNLLNGNKSLMLDEYALNFVDGEESTMAEFILSQDEMEN